METILIIGAVVFVVFLLVKAGRKIETRDATTMLDAELIRYKAQFEQRATLSLRAGDGKKYEFYTAKIQELSNEISKRRTGLSQGDMTKLTGLIKKHAELVVLLMRKNGYTEEQATAEILNEIDLKKIQYQKEGLNENDALEKASVDVYCQTNMHAQTLPR